jgi:cytochrome P450
MAGSETTISLLSGLTNHLLRNRRCYDKLVAEIRGSFKQESDISSRQLSELPYFNACLEEGLRIFPPVPIGLLRTVPEGGATIDGNLVAAEVSSCPISMLKYSWDTY